MHRLPIPRLQQFKHRCLDPHPHDLTVEIALVPQRVGASGSLKLGVRAVLIDQEQGGGGFTSGGIFGVSSGPNPLLAHAPIFHSGFTLSSGW